MIEYLYNAIKATSGEDFTICANITDDEGNAITECESYFRVLKDNKELFRVAGNCGECWEYNIPAELTEGFRGTYWYCICADGSTLQFSQPIYFV